MLKRPYLSFMQTVDESLNPFLRNHNVKFVTDATTSSFSQCSSVVKRSEADGRVYKLIPARKGTTTQACGLQAIRNQTRNQQAVDIYTKSF